MRMTFKVEASSDPTLPGVISLGMCSRCIILQHQSCLAERNKKDVFYEGIFLDQLIITCL